MRISDWSSDVCSSDLCGGNRKSAPSGQRRESQAESVARQAHSTIHVPAPFMMLPVRGFIGVSKSTAASGTIVTRTRRLTTLRLLFAFPPDYGITRSEAHTSELKSLMRISYAVF